MVLFADDDLRYTITQSDKADGTSEITSQRFSHAQNTNLSLIHTQTHTHRHTQTDTRTQTHTVSNDTCNPADLKLPV